MRKVSKEFDCETRGEEWWREAVKEQRETGQSETKKTLKLVLKSMTQWNRERIGTVFDPVSVKNQTSICSREGFGEHTGSRFRKRIRNMSHFLWSMSALQHWSGSDDQELCLFIPVGVGAAMQPLWKRFIGHIYGRVCCVLCYLPCDCVLCAVISP